MDFSTSDQAWIQIETGDTEGRTRAVVIGDALAEILTARGIHTSVEHHGLTPPAPQK
ncbi:hypothetical protein [Streptomyces sp. NPDC051211]|uniref:hypothetical protein n=1 Tax=Streptomyces sp. NPDC051211 TaxID=3154643 RepID=UPI00344D6BB2